MISDLLLLEDQFDGFAARPLEFLESPGFKWAISLAKTLMGENVSFEHENTWDHRFCEHS